MPHEFGRFYGVMEAKGTYNKHATIPAALKALNSINPGQVIRAPELI